MVIASSNVSLNLNRNLVLQGSMMQVVGFIFLMMLHISSFSRGQKPVILSISCDMTFLCSGHETVPYFFGILFRKKSANMFGMSDEDSVDGIGFSSFCFVSDLKML